MSTIATDRRVTRKVGILFLAACLVVIWPGAGIAHWPGSVDSSADTATGHAELGIDGALHLELEPCETGGAESGCQKFENDDLLGLPTFEFGSGAVRILAWIDKTEADGTVEHVGFEYEVVGGIADITIKSGTTELTLNGIEAGEHTWIDDSCTDNGERTATCPMGTPAISIVELCITVEVAGICPTPPLMSAELRNDGTVPLAVELIVGDLVIDPPGAFCDERRVDATLAIGGPSDTVYADDVCAFPGFAADLGVVDPGGTVWLHLSGAVAPNFDPAFSGTHLEFPILINGTLWNTAAWATATSTLVSLDVGGEPPAEPEISTEVTEGADTAEPAIQPPPTAEPADEKPPAVTPPVKPPEEEPAPPAPPVEEPAPPQEPDPTPPPVDPDPVPPSDDPVPEPPPVEPPPEDPAPPPPPEDPPPPPEDPVPEPPPVEPPPEEPPPPDEPAPPATPAIGYIHLAGHDERVEGTAASSGVGDLRAVMLINVAEWASGAEQILLSHWGSSVEDRSFLIRLTPAGQLALDVHDGGFVSYITDAVEYPDGEWLWLQVTLDAALGDDGSRVQVFSSDEDPTTDVRAVSWGSPDFAVTKNRTVARHAAPNRVFKIGGHGTHAPAAMDVALIALRAERRSGQSELVFASDWRADGMFTGNPPSRIDDAAPEIEWTLLGRDIEHIPSALAFIDWLPTVVLATAPALTTSARKRTMTHRPRTSAGNPGIAGDANAGGGDAGALS